MPEATARRDSDCPLLDAVTRGAQEAALGAATELALRLRDFLAARPEEEQAAWLQAAMPGARELFQPWSMEILYLAGLSGTTRFSELEARLGISSRTLSNRLRALTAAGHLVRVVHDEVPVRVEYSLTRRGGSVARLAAPLFCALNQQALAAQEGRVRPSP